MNTIQQLIESRKLHLNLIAQVYILRDWLLNKDIDTSEAYYDNRETDTECLNHFNGMKRNIEYQLPF